MWFFDNVLDQTRTFQVFHLLLSKVRGRCAELYPHMRQALIGHCRCQCTHETSVRPRNVATKLLSRLLSIPQLRQEGYAPNYLPLVTVYYCQHQRSLGTGTKFVLYSYTYGTIISWLPSSSSVPSSMRDYKAGYY
jgi:hypothetical protein